MLVNVLGLAGRARKKSILHEAASAIKGLKRECNQLRRERDHLQQELNNLASYLQSTGADRRT
ncbi:Myc-type, basic helix-loop-helix (bHLH) domain [Phytophthora cactorum]|nr:Myc-type, basic helix-loop-helix (bHLH) domain [Phytophthora cactorum]